MHPIRVNTVGYLPDRAKVATVVSPGGTTFDVHRAADGSVAWTGPLTGPLTVDMGDQVWLADFSIFSDAGDYYLEVPGLGKSAPFHVGSDAFDDAFKRGMLGMYGQRCGTDVSITLETRTWGHKACHTQDAYLTYATGEDTIKPSLRGWHDAGDYGKYITNGAFTVGMLLEAWQHFQPKLMGASLPIPEHGGAIPDFLAEVKWELDWLLTTQGADGSVAHKVTALNFESFILPEADSSKRYYTGPGTSATGDLVAVLAAAARIYQPYDADFAARCLTAAQASYAYLAANPKTLFPDLSKFKTGEYGDDDDSDERLWAAAEMWETTGDPAALADFETRAKGVRTDDNFDWGNVQNLGIFTYVLSKRTGRDPALVAALSASVVSSADGIATVSSGNGYGRGIDSYWWGSNGAVARTAMNLAVANTLSPAPKYLDTIAAQLDHLLGRNPFDRSQITALGYHPPLRPHHRPSAADDNGDPWPGLLVGGSSDRMPWKDTQDDYEVNEVAINWTGAFVYATAALLPH